MTFHTDNLKVATLNLCFAFSGDCVVDMDDAGDVLSFDLEMDCLSPNELSQPPLQGICDFFPSGFANFMQSKYLNYVYCYSVLM